MSASSVAVSLTFSKAVTEDQAFDAFQVFFRELLDQELRELIIQETAPLRDLILAHAYSRTGLPSDEPT